MLAAPSFVVAASIEPLDEFEVLLQRQGRVDTSLMERCKKNTKSHPVGHRALLDRMDKKIVDNVSLFPRGPIEAGSCYLLLLATTATAAENANVGLRK